MMPSRPCTSQGRSTGFTLIELLITIAIAVIAMAVAVPSFVTFQRNAELTSTANSLIAAINAARGEAMKRNMNVIVAPSTANGWTGGIRVYVDTDRDSAFTSGTDIVVMLQDAAPPSLDVTNVTSVGAGAPAAATFLMFNGSGYATNSAGAATFVRSAMKLQRTGLAGADVFKQSRIVMVAKTGRVRVCTPKSASDDNCRIDNQQYLD